MNESKIHWRHTKKTMVGAFFLSAQPTYFPKRVLISDQRPYMAWDIEIIFVQTFIRASLRPSNFRFKRQLITTSTYHSASRMWPHLTDCISEEYSSSCSHTLVSTNIRYLFYT